MKYRAEIDGLRAVAVIPVVFFHAGFAGFTGGFVGVDVFFVISGYLITTIILSEKQAGTFSLINFYERRARRILPALFFICLVSLPFAWLWLYPSDMKDFSQSLVAVSTYLSNILFLGEAGYWDTASELKPMLHTWSLAVEEQYYVLFPLFILLMWRFGKRLIFVSFIVIAAISLAVAQWGAYQFPTANFFLLPTRGWELAIGAAIAFYFLAKKRARLTIVSNKSIEEALGWLGLLMIGYSVYVYDETVLFPSFYTLIPTIGAGLIIVFASSETSVGRFLGAKPLVGIGLISYSAYLWHYPLFAFARHRSLTEPKALLFTALAISSFILAYLSWRFVEKPFRTKEKFSRRTIFVFSLTGSLFFVTIGMAGHLTDGYDQRRIVTALKVRNYQPDNKVLRKASWGPLGELSGSVKHGKLGNNFEHTLWFMEDDPRQKLLLVGDSHSKDMYNILINSAVAKAHFQIARYGSEISELYENTANLFSAPNYKQSDIVMLVSRYSEDDLHDDAIELLVDRLIAAKKSVAIVKNIHEFYWHNGKNTADILLQKKMIIDGFEDDSAFISEVVNEIDKAYYQEFISGDRRPVLQQLDNIFESIKQTHSEVKILNRMDYICNHSSQKCFSINDQFEKYFYDYGHHTLAGAVFFGEQVDQVGWLNPLID